MGRPVRGTYRGALLATLLLLAGAVQAAQPGRAAVATPHPSATVAGLETLAQGGNQVDWVADGRLVRRALRAERYDALILDLGLPGLAGDEVLKSLREDDDPVPILILTARDTLAEVRLAMGLKYR